jgi:predicted TIM-barrel fold metal-dependent hydrolase
LTHTFRLIVSGLFDEFPTLKIIVGHLGETAPFLLWRTDNILSERAPMPRAFANTTASTFG